VQYNTKSGRSLNSNIVELLDRTSLSNKYYQNSTQVIREALSWYVDDWPEVEHISGNGYMGDLAFPVLQQSLGSKQYATNLGALTAPLSRGNVTVKRCVAVM
jgi:choline dehydrogenase